MSVRGTISWINRMRATNMTWKDIALELYQDAPTESAAVGRLYRFREAIKDEKFDSKVVDKGIDAFELTTDATSPIPFWGGTEGAIRDDRITWEELKYLAQAGRSDTRRKANKIIQDILEREGVTDLSAISDKETFNRPMTSRTIKGVRVSWRFGRGKSDIQQMRIKKQLRDKGISWSSAYADFAGYGGL